MDHRAEREVLRFSLFSITFFIVLALVFALLTGSGAILFDGVYSLIAFSMSLVTLWVSNLLSRPSDDSFPFGYAFLEPALNLFKSVIILVACVYAIAAAIIMILDGGKNVENGLAVLYGALSAGGGLCVAIYISVRGHNIGSDLVRVESKKWLMDGLFSFAVMLGFLFSWFIEKTTFAIFSDFVDPALLLLLTLLVLPVPIKIFWFSFREVIAMAPTCEHTTELERLLNRTIENDGYDVIALRILKVGRTTYVLGRLFVPERLRCRTVSDFDELRQSCETKLIGLNRNIEMDLMFTSIRE